MRADGPAHNDLAVRVAQLGPVQQPSTLVDDERARIPASRATWSFGAPVRQRVRHRRHRGPVPASTLTD
jgi:hypothetical protein